MMIIEGSRTARPEGTTHGMPAALARVLSALLVVLLAVASAAGLFVPGLYEDPEPVGAMLRAYDLIPLVLAVPILAVALLPAQTCVIRVLIRTGKHMSELVGEDLLGYADLVKTSGSPRRDAGGPSSSPS
jgi:hypothetical protein